MKINPLVRVGCHRSTQAGEARRASSYKLTHHSPSVSPMNNSSASSHAIPNILAAEMNCTACHQPSPVDLKECGISSPSAASERGFQINELTGNMPSCCNKYEIPIVICVTSPVTDEKMSENHYKIAENFSPTFSCNNGFSADNNDVVSVTNNAAIPVDRSGVMSIAINGTSKIDNSDSALADNNHTVLVAPSETKSNDHSSGLCSDFPLVYCSSSIFRPNVLQVSESRQQFIGPDEDSNSVMAGMNGLGVTPGAQDGIVILFPNRLSLTRQLSVRSIKERWWQIGVQVVIPLMFAGFGMVAAGIVLDIVQHWLVFEHLSEIFILVPALLGLKGNLEMTLASRLSTQANLGKMDDTAAAWRMIGFNLALTQLQAVVVGLLASVVTMLLGWIPKQKFDFSHAILLCSSSVLTASFASILLGLVMGSVVFFARKCRVNPDNVATPVAGTLGDLITLSILAFISSGLYSSLYVYELLAPCLLMIVLAMTPFWWHLARQHEVTAPVVISGWLPIVLAMVISSLGGLVLDRTVSLFAGVAVFQPVVNGIGGNLVGIHSSRLSTELHRKSTPGSLPGDITTVCPNPVSAFCNKGYSARTAHILLIFVVPSHTVFMILIHFLASHQTILTPAFVSLYLLVCLVQVAILLMLSHSLVHALWKHGSDPDNAAIPFLTAAGDFLGGIFLSGMFHLLYHFGDPNAQMKG